jgi:hypothetical protein
VATLVRAPDARWADGSAVAEGRRLLPGRLRLTAGSAVLGFDGGATAVLAGPADLELDSATAATLRSGRLTVRAAEEASGFTLRTPRSEVVDLGTEFAATVEPGGAEVVQALDGSVELVDRRAPETAAGRRVLAAGKALRLADGLASALEIPVTARPVADLLAEAAPRVRPGRLMAYDGFDYPAPSVATPQAVGGFGWDGPWYRGWFGDLRGRIDISADGGRFPGLAAPVGGAAALNPPDPLVYKRRLAEPIDLDSDSVRYVSFVVRRHVPPGPGVKPQVRFILNDGILQGPRLGFGMLGDLRPFVFVKGMPNAVADRKAAVGVPHLFVGKIVTGRESADQAFLKMFAPGEAVDASEPAAWTVEGAAARLGGRMDEIHLGYGPFGGYSVDEIRVGTTWESVTPR